MATAAQYRQWMADNADKQGTESYAAIKEAYDLVSREEADSGASPGPLRVTVPTASNYAAWLENNRDLEGTEDYTAVQQALAIATEPVETVAVPPSEVAPPETTAAGLGGALVRGLGPTAAFAGLGGALAGPPGALVGAAVPAVTQLVGDPIVSGVNALLGTQFDTPSRALENLLTSIGVPEARTAAERVLQTTAGAVGGGAGMIGLGRGLMTQLPGAAQTVVTGVGEALAAQPTAQLVGSATGGAASQVTAEAGGGPLAQIAAGLVGGGAGAAAAMRPSAAATIPRAEPVAPVASEPAPVMRPEPTVSPRLTGEELAATTRAATGSVFGKTAAQRILAQEAAPDPKTVEAAKRLGIEDYLQPDHVTTNQAYRELAQAVKSVPGSAVRAREIENLTEVGKRADDLIRELGGTTDLSRVSSRVKEGLSKTIDDLETQAGFLYDKIAEALPRTATVEASNVLKFLNQQIIDLGGKQNLSPMEKTLLSKLAPKEDGTLPTYALTDQQRKAIGRASKQQGPFANEDTALAGKYYRLLTDDQGAVADAFGQAATWKAAKDLVSVRKGLEDDMVSLFGKQIDQSLVGKLGDATMSLSKGDAEKLAKIMQAIPQKQRQMVAASALNTAFGKATQNGALNFNSFANWYEGLLANRQAYTALVSNLPKEARKNLSDLYRVSRGVRNATRERITTGRIQAVAAELQGADTVMATIYDKAKRAAIGLPIEGALAMVGIPPGMGMASGVTAALVTNKEKTIKAADTLIASPEFERLVTDIARTGGKPKPGLISIVRNSRAFKDYAKAVGLRGTQAEINAFLSGNPQEETE
jgi:hypothetical protein